MRLRSKILTGLAVLVASFGASHTVGSNVFERTPKIKELYVDINANNKPDVAWYVDGELREIFLDDGEVLTLNENSRFYLEKLVGEYKFRSVPLDR